MTRPVAKMPGYIPWARQGRAIHFKHGPPARPVVYAGRLSASGASTSTPPLFIATSFSSGTAAGVALDVDSGWVFSPSMPPRLGLIFEAIIRSAEITPGHARRRIMVLPRPVFTRQVFGACGTQGAGPDIESAEALPFGRYDRMALRLPAIRQVVAGIAAAIHCEAFKAVPDDNSAGFQRSGVPGRQYQPTNWWQTCWRTGTTSNIERLALIHCLKHLSNLELN